MKKQVELKTRPKAKQQQVSGRPQPVNQRVLQEKTKAKLRLMVRFSSTAHGLQILVRPVGVELNRPINNQGLYQGSTLPVPMYSEETRTSTTIVDDKNADNVSTGNETIYLFSDSEYEEKMHTSASVQDERGKELSHGPRK